MESFLKCVELDLYPSNLTGEAYLIPYGKEAQFQLGYQGMIEIARRAGTRNICSNVVYANDEFDYEYGTNQYMKHTPNVFGDRGEAIGVYAIAKLKNGEDVFKIMSKADVFAFREKSQGYKRDVKNRTKYSPWQPENDPMLNMWMKTSVRQLFKMLPKTPEINAAIAADTSGDIDMKVINPDNDDNVMDQTDITAWYKDMVNVKGYTTEFVTEGMVAILERTELTGMTKDQAEKIEKWLCDKSTEEADVEQTAAEQEQAGLNYGD
jgi:recombinational DNA repair protein RecT